jgi:fatty acid desaturase
VIHGGAGRRWAWFVAGIAVCLVIGWFAFVRAQPVPILSGVDLAFHEASHFNLFTPKWLKELAGHFISWQEGFDFPQFRAQHFLHPRHYGTPQDPDWEKSRQLADARSDST